MEKITEYKCPKCGTNIKIDIIGHNTIFLCGNDTLSRAYLSCPICNISIEFDFATEVMTDRELFKKMVKCEYNTLCENILADPMVHEWEQENIYRVCNGMYEIDFVEYLLIKALNKTN